MIKKPLTNQKYDPGELWIVATVSLHSLYTRDMYLPAVEMWLTQSSMSLRRDWSEYELKFAITMLSGIPL